MSDLVQSLSFKTGETPHCQIIDQNIAVDDFNDKELPTDVHLIRYTICNKSFTDVVRAQSMVDIFDAYYDKLNRRGEINAITSGYGHINPKLYGKIKSSAAADDDED